MVGTEEVFAGSQVRTIACGGEHTMGVTESGELGRGASERMDDWASI
jgi:alpha-tubulin suppressor-like RCC1 family protein